MDWAMMVPLVVFLGFMGVMVAGMVCHAVACFE